MKTRPGLLRSRRALRAVLGLVAALALFPALRAVTPSRESPLAARAEIATAQRPPAYRHSSPTPEAACGPAESHADGWYDYALPGNGSLRGMVRVAAGEEAADADGAVNLTRFRLELISDRGRRFTAQCDRRGRFVLNPLSAGTYRARLYDALGTPRPVTVMAVRVWRPQSAPPGAADLLVVPAPAQQRLAQRHAADTRGGGSALGILWRGQSLSTRSAGGIPPQAVATFFVAGAIATPIVYTSIRDDIDVPYSP